MMTCCIALVERFLSPENRGIVIREQLMGPSAFCQFKCADFKNRCYTGIWGASTSFSCLKTRFVHMKVINVETV